MYIPVNLLTHVWRVRVLPVQEAIVDVCIVIVVQAVADLFGNDRLFTAHVVLLSKLRRFDRVLHPLQQLLVGHKPHIRLL